MNREPNTKKIDVYGGEDPALLPFCSLSECAEWLKLPASTVRAWFFGQRGFEAVLEPADSARRMLSFINLTEVFVLAAIRRQHGIPLPRVREAVRYLQQRYGDAHPLARREMMTEGSALLIERLSLPVKPSEQERVVLVSASEHGQVVSEELVRARLRRIERSPEGHPLRLYPLTRHSSADEAEILETAPTRVVIDPRVQYGRPCLSGSGVPTAVIHERWLAGEDMQEIALDYGQELADVQEALRFEDRRAA